ncbi:hypothetical protein BDV28DRAFT_58307 [Aspergillus coremiiformis]|uniref:Uncharacterized protein n=1 Tax=Aspergillus coremiiformis TaxID=138285 RepID=A0A5N6ZD97_9EURO|nr:hypothetical protein BDV28DRAFT_58307 [Aspergillus coremiiformis]
MIRHAKEVLSINAFSRLLTIIIMDAILSATICGFSNASQLRSFQPPIQRYLSGRPIQSILN